MKKIGSKKAPGGSPTGFGILCLMNRLQRLGHPIWVAGCLLGCAVNDPASAAAPVPLVAQQDAPLFPAGSADDHDPYDSGGVLIPEQASYDVLFYDLDIEVFPEERAIRGTVGIEASLGGPLTHFVVDLAPELEVEAALWIDEESAAHERPFERRGGRIWIDLGRTFQPEDRLSMRIRYGGKPRVAKNAPWDGGVTWAKTPSGEHWIATTCQGEGADIWWPVKDHVSDEPEAMGIHVTVPEPLVAACNGRLLGVDEADGKRTYHWGVSTPINAYAVALNIAPYEVIEGELESVSGETFPVFFWVLPEHLEKGKVLFEEILDHVRFHEELLGPYPFRIDKYGVAETPHLGMEHQSIIAYGARFDNGAMTGGQDWGFDALHHHELSHEWWGNLVTNAQWSDMWLHEGFGSYMQPLYLESRQSKDRYHAYMKSVRQRMTNRQPLASRETLSSSEIYNGDIYFKGTWVLHTLRYLI
ncbi:MAG: M1 family metallopeptidase, partial [Planctomycetota bacterium]